MFFADKGNTISGYRKPDSIENEVRQGIIYIRFLSIQFLLPGCGDCLVNAAAQVAGGNGGGRPDMAQAGGKEPAKLMEALKAGGEALTSMLQ